MFGVQLEAKMGQFFAKQSPDKFVDQAKGFKTDLEPLNVVRQNLRDTADDKTVGCTITFRPAKGVLKKDRHIYAGDLSHEDQDTVSQIRPILSIEYMRKSHAAIVRHGVSGDMLMMLVRELPDNPFFGENGQNFRCAFGGKTEVRLYANGRPVSVTADGPELSVAPSPQVNGEERPQLGASMVELMVVNQGNAISFHKKKKDGKPGKQLALYAKVKGTAAVFKMEDNDVVDPIVLIVMAWHAAVERNMI